MPMSVPIWKKSRVETKQGYGDGWEAQEDRRAGGLMTKLLLPAYFGRNCNLIKSLVFECYVGTNKSEP
jgi:hypothetical protein